MGSYNSNILPTSGGLTLGTTQQKWTAHLQDIFTGSVISDTVASASTGFIRMAATNAIAWRNFADTGNVLLGSSGTAVGTVPADCLAFNGNGFLGVFVSSALNPAATGAVRLAAGDTIKFRNTANGGDIVGLQHNADDSITVGGAGGFSTAGNLTVNGTLTTTGAATVASESVTGNLTVGGTAAVSGTTTTNGLIVSNGSITTPVNTAIAITAVGPASGAGTDVTITAGSATGGSLAGGKVILAAGGSSGAAAPSTIAMHSRVSEYGPLSGYTTAGNGLVAEYAAVDQVGVTAAIGTTTLYTIPAYLFGPAQYRVSWNATVTTAAGVSSTLGALTIGWTDAGGVAQTLTAPATIAAGTIATTNAGNTTTSYLLGMPVMLNCQLNTIITYAMAYASNAANAMAYSLHIRLEAM